MLPWQCYVQEAFGRKDVKNGHKIMVLCAMLSEIISKSTFGVCNMNQHPILSLFTKFELNWLRNKKGYEKTSFSMERVAKLESLS